MSWFMRMMLLALPGILTAYTYVGWRVVMAIGQITAWPQSTIRWGAILAAGYLNLYPIILLSTSLLQMTARYNALRGGHRWADALIVFPFWAGLIIVVEILPFIFLMDLARLPLWPWFQKHRALWIKWQAIVTCALFVVFILYVGVRILRDTYSVRLTTREVRLPSLPAELNGFRLVQLSDLQADPYTGERKMQAYIDLANAQKPDLILFGGDLVTRGTDYIEQGAKRMGRLQARLGVYACLGDHDYWAGPAAVTRHLRENGVTTLEDSVVNLAGSQSKISLTIVTNVYSRRPSLATLSSLRRHRAEDAALNILLSHQPSPDIVAYAEEQGYHLLLAGHTHGGQVVFKPLGIPVSVSHFETPYYSGFYQIGNLLLSVTNGLGLTIAPIRYQAPAEVTLLILRRK